MTKNTAVWNSGLNYVLASAFEAGVGATNITLSINVSGVDGTEHAIRLAADLAKCGARVTKTGDMLTVDVSDDNASELLRRNSENGQGEKNERIQRIFKPSFEEVCGDSAAAAMRYDEKSAVSSIAAACEADNNNRFAHCVATAAATAARAVATRKTRGYKLGFKSILTSVDDDFNRRQADDAASAAYTKVVAALR